MIASEIRQERYEWIKQWLTEHLGPVDVLNAEFVDAYIDKFNAAFIPQPFGSFKCKQLGQDLGAMYKEGILSRHATGLPSGDSDMGFPKWIYCYSLVGKRRIGAAA